ncbi:MAG: isopentenyl-diphosphate Delta-isomerase [Chitinophagales bacterium]
MEDIAKEEQVVLVDENCTELGLMGKLEAHQKGVLHKAISIIIFNSNGDMLVQQRAFSKYHWAGIWSNTCCSHPRAGESFEDAAQRRLFEELGFRTHLKPEFSFIYKAYDTDSGLTEHEYDWVFTGVYDDEFEFNPEEIHEVRWLDRHTLLKSIQEEPDQWSFWFKIILREMEKRQLY